MCTVLQTTAHCFGVIEQLLLYADVISQVFLSGCNYKRFLSRNLYSLVIRAHTFVISGPGVISKQGGLHQGNADFHDPAHTFGTGEQKSGHMSRRLQITLCLSIILLVHRQMLISQPIFIVYSCTKNVCLHLHLIYLLRM